MKVKICRTDQELIFSEYTYSTYLQNILKSNSRKKLTDILEDAKDAEQGQPEKLIMECISEYNTNEE